MQQLAAVDPPDTPALPPARRMWVRSAAALAVGAFILGLFIYNSDLDAVQESMGTLGWVSPLVLLPYLVVNIFDTLGWRCTLPPAVAARVPFVSLYLTRMAGEAVNSLTVAVGGEPLKAHLLRAFGRSGSGGGASGGVAETGLTVSQSAPVLVGIAALFDPLERRAVGA